MITKGIISVLTTFYPEMKKFQKEHPDIIKEPKKKHQELL